MSGARPAPQGGKSRRLDQKEFPKSPARQAVWGFLVPFNTIQVRATYATYAPQSDKYEVQTGFKWGSKKAHRDGGPVFGISLLRRSPSAVCHQALRATR